MSQMRLNPLTGRWVTIVAERARRPTRLRAPWPPDRDRSGSSLPVLPGPRGRHPAGAGDRRRRRRLADARHPQPVPGVRRRRPASSSTTSARSTSPPRPAASTRCSCYTPRPRRRLRPALDDDDAADLMHVLQRRLAEHAAAPEVRYTPGHRQPRPRGRRVARPPPRPDPRPAVRARRDPRRGAGVRPLRRRLRASAPPSRPSSPPTSGSCSPTTTSCASPRSGAARRSSCCSCRAATSRTSRTPTRSASTRWAAASATPSSHLNAALGDVAYNLGFHTAPHEHAGQFHWHVHLWPNLVTAAGFERGTGVMINVMPPEPAAETLRRRPRPRVTA